MDRHHSKHDHRSSRRDYRHDSSIGGSKSFRSSHSQRHRSRSSDERPSGSGPSRHREKPSSHRRRCPSRSPSIDRNTKAQHQEKHPDVPETTNLVDFSFLDYKSDLNKLLLGFTSRDKIIDDASDFWLFLTKYETMLKKSGQCILPNPEEDLNVPGYHKSLNTNLLITTPFAELYGRLSNYDRASKLSEYKVQQFIQIVVHYLDFRQKEKFNKLKKLRRSQANLPVAKYKQEIIDAVRGESVVLIAGDTGCGKSTQVPQYLYEAGYGSVACTQPRRIACISLSKRVAHEMLCEFGTEVGYQIRFERSKSKDTKIVFITEGLLLRQLSNEAALSQYDVIVLDEVHERHLHGDFLLGVTKCLLKARPDLKLILMSATINVKLFSDYFAEEEAHVIEVPGRLYPIKLHYMPQVQELGVKQSKAERLSPEPYIQIMQLIDNKYPKTERGDLLIFMSGLNEITAVVDAAKEYAEKDNNWIILPLHSSLSIADQDKVFDYPPDGIRKCIVSTNIAETSVTIDGIRFVVDSGKVKEMSYDPVSKMQRLKEFWISKASADQRKGRAGRTGPGVCYRIYSEKSFLELEAYSAAEIQRVPLESLLLQMISMGLPDARLFPFIEPPPSEAIENGILSLKHHDALTADEKLTPLGKALARLPVDITIGKMLLMGCVFQQLQPVLTMAAALSVQSPFTNRAYRDHECETARKDLESDHGDPITILNAYKEWLELKQARFSRRGETENTKNWCRRRGLEEQRFYEITKLRNQFQELLKDCGLSERSNEKELSSGERAIRHGELRQLKEMKRAHKYEAPRKRKILKSDPWGLGEADEDDNAVDMRDIDFRMSHDPSKMNSLVSGATACSYRDLMTLKLILVSGLYPQIAIADEFNYLKSPGQQFYHTQAKPFTSLHPMGYFGNNPQILQLTEPEIEQQIGPYKSKLALSSKHQLLCYLSLLETTKPYLMNTLRMPAAQTLLLFAHSIDTNSTFSRILCDSWLCLDFPQPESGQHLLLKASNLRRSWNALLANKLEALTRSADSDLTTDKREAESRQLEMELWQSLAQYMSTEVPYTIKRLLPADLKSLYVGFSEDESADLLSQLDPNPFADGFVCVPCTKKGGIYITENILYACVNETEWSIQIADMIVTNEWKCPNCDGSFYINGIQRLQHKKDCAPKEKTAPPNDGPDDPNSRSQCSNTRKYDCSICKKTLYLSSVQILKHKKTCK